MSKKVNCSGIVSVSFDGYDSQVTISGPHDIAIEAAKSLYMQYGLEGARNVMDEIFAIYEKHDQKARKSKTKSGGNSV